MAQELVAHVCKLCGSAWQTRKKAKLHVNLKHYDKVYAQHGPGQQIDYLWLDLSQLK